MKRKRRQALCLLLSVLLTLLCALPVSADEALPVLQDIAFDNAEIDGGFSPDVFSYTLTLADSSKSPTLQSYTVAGEGELLVDYTYDENGVQTGLLATLRYASGSAVYTFTYTNTQPLPTGSDNTLRTIYCALGELKPAVTAEETDYTLYIPADLTTLTITPVPNDTNAVCPAIDLTLSETQAPELLLVCTAADGSEREYHLQIKRVDKTVAAVQAEMAQEDYVSFVEQAHLTDKPQFYVVLGCAAAGVLLLWLLHLVVVRKTAVTRDENEPSFYRTE